ncbi:MAG: TIGR02594 family protein [Desulfobacteraceae bacterium]|nr:TIGR02594 family protein [Desulfobacteraceae bacterium]
MKFSELESLGFSREVWSLIQRGLNHAGFYNGTYKGRPGVKTRAAYNAYISDESDEPKWMDIARKEMGTKEYLGDADNPEVLKYLKSVDTLSISAQRNDETAWCSSFVNWCMEAAGIRGTENAAARSWLQWGREIDMPEIGCVVVLWRGSPNGWQGHVGFYVKETATSIFLLGGNQGDQVNINRYAKNRVLGYRMA